MTNAALGALVDKEQTTWLAYLDATRLLFEELDRRVSEDAGISLADFGVLVRLADADEWGMRMSDLAELTVFSRSRISHAVDRLETLGLVERRACPTDRRGSYAALTDAGRQKLTQALPGHSEIVRRHLFDQLSDEEVDGFRASMTAVKESLQEAGSSSVA